MKKALTYDDVLIVPRYSSVRNRSDVVLSQQIRDIYFHSPILAANMDTVTGSKMVTFMDDVGGMGVLPRTFSVSEITHILQFEKYYKLGISVGSIFNEHEKITSLVQTLNSLESNVSTIPIIFVEIAHGHSEHMKNTLKFLKENLTIKKYVLVGGNVCTPEAVEDLVSWGADMVKVGIGPGAVCTTRTKTGCGYPQFDAIRECCLYANVPIIADGGIRSPGDAAKALAAGASLVMTGFLFAGTDGTPNWVDGEKTVYRGMASKEAKIDANLAPYNIEGTSAEVWCGSDGSTKEVHKSILDGIRSAMSYSGAHTLQEFRNMANFIEVTPNAVLENSVRLF